MTVSAGKTAARFLAAAALLVVPACSSDVPVESFRLPEPSVLVRPAAAGYAAGDTGPGGGTVFAVFSTPFACGPTLASTCTYLEAAPDAWSGVVDPAGNWSDGTGAMVGTGTALGHGHRNTLAALAQDPSAGSAVTMAQRYDGGGLSDWFLPSKEELNELCKYARNQDTGDTGVSCNSTGTLRAGFASTMYWSSSEHSASGTWRQKFSHGNQGVSDAVTAHRVRPVRAG